MCIETNRKLLILFPPWHIPRLPHCQTKHCPLFCDVGDDRALLCLWACGATLCARGGKVRHSYCPRRPVNEELYNGLDNRRRVGKSACFKERPKVSAHVSLEMIRTMVAECGVH